MKPLVFDLFCGLGGWSEAFIAEGYDAIGFDIEAHDYGNGGYPGELVLCDVRQLKGAELVKQYGIPACIVASPPCQEFSYMAMPWSKAKEKRRKIKADPKEQVRLCELFNECFRIQKEVSDAAGRYVPIIIENVRGAQEWVGRSRWNFGSFHLWGDVPALMLCDAMEGCKNFTPNGEPLGKNTIGRRCGSKSKKRKQASAEIAKIPYALAVWIARVFKPHQTIPSEEKLAKSKGV